MNTTTNYQYLATPLGTLRLVSNGQALVRIEFSDMHGDDGEQQEDAILEQTASQLREYFEGKRKCFSVPLAAQGTEFQQQVWSVLQSIPFGELRSYRDIAEGIGNRKAVRALALPTAAIPFPS